MSENKGSTGKTFHLNKDFFYKFLPLPVYGYEPSPTDKQRGVVALLKKDQLAREAVQGIFSIGEVAPVEKAEKTEMDELISRVTNNPKMQSWIRDNCHMGGPCSDLSVNFLALFSPHIAFAPPEVGSKGNYRISNVAPDGEPICIQFEANIPYGSAIIQHESDDLDSFSAQSIIKNTSTDDAAPEPVVLHHIVIEATIDKDGNVSANLVRDDFSILNDELYTLAEETLVQAEAKANAYENLVAFVKAFDLDSQCLYETDGRTGLKQADINKDYGAVFVEQFDKFQKSDASEQDKKAAYKFLLKQLVSDIEKESGNSQKLPKILAHYKSKLKSEPLKTNYKDLCKKLYKDLQGYNEQKQQTKNLSTKARLLFKKYTSVKEYLPKRNQKHNAMQDVQLKYTFLEPQTNRQHITPSAINH